MTRSPPLASFLDLLPFPLSLPLFPPSLPRFLASVPLSPHASLPPSLPLPSLLSFLMLPSSLFLRFLLSRRPPYLYLLEVVAGVAGGGTPLPPSRPHQRRARRRQVPVSPALSSCFGSEVGAGSDGGKEEAAGGKGAQQRLCRGRERWGACCSGGEQWLGCCGRAPLSLPGSSTPLSGSRTPLSGSTSGKSLHPRFVVRKEEEGGVGRRE